MKIFTFVLRWCLEGKINKKKSCISFKLGRQCYNTLLAINIFFFTYREDLSQFSWANYASSCLNVLRLHYNPEPAGLRWLILGKINVLLYFALHIHQYIHSTSANFQSAHSWYVSQVLSTIFVGEIVRFLANCFDYALHKYTGCIHYTNRLSAAGEQRVCPWAWNWEEDDGKAGAVRLQWTTLTCAFSDDVVKSAEVRTEVGFFFCISGKGNSQS